MISCFYLFAVLLCLGTVAGSDSNEGTNKTDNLPKTRIVGGVEAVRHEFPFIVSLYRSSSPAVGHFCGGSIIERSWVLTAAHCVTQPDFRMAAGKHDLRNIEEMEQRVSIETVIPHPKYDPRNFDNDLALVKVTPPFDYTNHVKSFQIPQTGFAATGQVTTAGWGVTSENGKVASPVLRKVTVDALENSACAARYGNGFSIEKMICAGIIEGGKDACQGDSGGPLLCDDHRFGDTLCGVVSFGEGCAREAIPGVYTKVAFYSDWIHAEMEKYARGEGPKTNLSDHEVATRPPGRPRRTQRPRHGKGNTVKVKASAVLSIVAVLILKIFLC